MHYAQAALATVNICLQMWCKLYIFYNGYDLDITWIKFGYEEVVIGQNIVETNIYKVITFSTNR